MFAILTAALMFLLHFPMPASMFDGRPLTPEEVSVSLKRSAALMNLTLPKAVDEVTTWESASVDGLIWTNRFTAIVDPDDVADTIEYLSENLPSLICPDLFVRRMIRGRGVTYRYRYVFQPSFESYVQDVDEAVCQSLGE